MAICPVFRDHFKARNFAILAQDFKVTRLWNSMTIIRFVHAADLHLDSPFVGIKSVAPKNVAGTLYDATFEAYDNIIKLCIDEKVDALLVAGDVFDSADRSLRAQFKFIKGLNELDEAGIRSFICHGNHDPLNGWQARLDYPLGCTRFGSEFQAVPVFDDDPKRAVVHGISFPTRDVHDNLVSRLSRVDPDSFSIGLLHTNVDNRPGHDQYAPCSIDDLVRSEIDYWALGHIHTREVLSAQSPTIVYPGNSQGRHLNESGARGVYLVEVANDGNIQLDFRPIDAIRWESRVLDISKIETEQDLRDEFYRIAEDSLAEADDRSVVLRIRLVGRGELHTALRQPNFMDDLSEELVQEWSNRMPFAWCEGIEDDTAPLFNRHERIHGSDFLAEVLKTADRAKDNPESLALLQDSLDDLYLHRRYRKYLTDGVPGGDDLASLIDDAEAVIVDLLTGDEAA